jgi:hypothetical protein
VAKPVSLVYLKQSKALLVADKSSCALDLIDPSTGKMVVLYSSPKLADIDFVFTDPNEQYLFYTLNSEPGIWSLKLGTDALCTLTALEQASRQATPAVVTAYVYKVFNLPLTAWTNDAAFFYFILYEPGLERTSVPLRFVNLLDPAANQPLDYHFFIPTRAPAEGAATQGPFKNQNYQLFTYASGLAFDKAQQIFYVADRDNQRILKIKKNGQYSPQEYLYPAQPAPNVHRIIVLGSSFNYCISDEIPYRENSWQVTPFSLNKRVEYWLNLLALMRNDPRRYEVAYVGTGVGFSESVMSFAIKNLALIDQFHADLVLYNYTYWDFLLDAMEYLYRPEEKGSLSLNRDDEFLMLKLSDRVPKMHPFGRELYALIKSNQDKLGNTYKIVEGKGDFNRHRFFEALNQPQFRDLCFKLASTRLGEYLNLIQKSNQAENRQTHLALNMIPVQPNLSRNEILFDSREEMLIPNFLSPLMSSWCEPRKIYFQDTIQISKIMEPTNFPMFDMNDNHYTKKTSDFVAFLTAYQLLDRVFSQPQTADIAHAIQ